MTRILGIDPGSRKTGYGIIALHGRRMQYIACGEITLANLPLTDRLAKIYQTLSDLILEYQPQQAAIEQIFVAKNPGSALKLGQARGVAMLSCVNQGLSLAEYSARTVKQAVVGTGAADKLQIQHMVRVLLSLDRSPKADAADALAIAICHGFSQKTYGRLSGVSHRARGRYSKTD